MNSTIKHTLFQQFFQKKYEKPKKKDSFLAESNPRQENSKVFTAIARY